MKPKFQVAVIKIDQKDGYRIFTLTVSDNTTQHEYMIYASDRDIPFKETELPQQKLVEFATDQMNSWIRESGGKFPSDKYRVLVHGGKITTDNVDSFFSVQKQTSDLIRTNVTIAAPLFEWAKAKAQKEGTSFSDLVTRGLLGLKESDKEVEAWFREQGAYFRQKLGDIGSFEVIHYLPNNYAEFGVDLLKEALQEAEVKRTGWPIGVFLTGGENRPNVQEDGIKAEYVDTPSLLLDFWYAKLKGEFYFSRNLESDSGHGEAQPKTCLFFDTLVWRVAESLEHCQAYYSELHISEDERVKLKISLYGLNGRFLSAWNRGRAFTLSHYKCGSEKSSWETEITLRELKSNLDETIYEAVKKLLLIFDFFVPAKEVIADILNQEYRKSNY